MELSYFPSLSNEGLAQSLSLESFKKPADDKKRDYPKEPIQKKKLKLLKLSFENNKTKATSRVSKTRQLFVEEKQTKTSENKTIILKQLTIFNKVTKKQINRPILKLNLSRVSEPPKESLNPKKNSIDLTLKTKLEKEKKKQLDNESFQNELKEQQLKFIEKFDDSMITFKRRMTRKKKQLESNKNIIPPKMAEIPVKNEKMLDHEARNDFVSPPQNQKSEKKKRLSKLREAVN